MNRRRRLSIDETYGMLWLTKAGPRVAVQDEDCDMVITAEIAPIKIDTDGVARVGGTRVTLDTVLAAFQDGATAEEIVYQYPALVLADVYAVIAQYLRHPAQIEEYLQLRRAEATAVRRQNEQRFDPYGVRDRLLARLGVAEA